MNRRTIIPMFSLLLASLSLAACATPQAAPASAPASGGAVDMNKPPKVDKIAFGITALQVESNKPHIACCTNQLQWQPMYDSLIGVTPEGKELQPQLATEWTLDADGRSFRFKLRPNIPFHNNFGNVTSADVLYTWETQRDETDPTMSPQPANVTRQDIKGIEVINDAEFILRAAAPNSGLLAAISQAEGIFPIRSKADGTARPAPPTMADKPIAGTGPYQFVSRAQSQNLKFERMPGTHWRKTADAKEFEFRFFKEASTMTAALLAKEIQLAGLPPDLVGQAEKTGARLIAGKGLGLHTFVSFYGVWINKRILASETLNADESATFVYPKSPLMYVRVRKALNKAINRDALNKAFLSGKGDPIYNEYFHPTRPGWNPAWETRFKDAYGYDVEAAKKLLAEAGYGPSNPATVTVQLRQYGYFPAVTDMNEAIAGYWRAIGIDVKMEQADAATFTARSRALAYDSHAFIVPTSIRQWLGVGIYNSMLAGNRGGVQLPEIDSTYGEIKATLDQKKYEELWKKLGDVTYDQYTSAPLFWVPSEVAVDPALIAGYDFPGSISSTYTHVEYITLAR